MRKLRITILGLVVGLACIYTAAAQDKKDEKITIKIIKEVDGEEIVLDKTYDSVEEMRKDPDYQKMVDDANIMVFEMPDMPRFEQRGPHAFSFRFGDEDFDFDFDREEIDRVMRRANVEIRRGSREIERALRELEKSIDEIDRDEIKAELRKLKDELRREGVLPPNIKGMSVTEVTADDFGRKAVVDDKERLELEDFEIMVFGNRGKVGLRFTLPQEGKLEVKVSDKGGDTVFVQSYGRYGGIYRDDIDMRDQQPGDYLLEIKLDDKRLTRKITMEGWD
jgi:hypothetical protein